MTTHAQSVAVVTGGGGPMGLAIARALGAEGRALVVNDRNEKRCAAAVESLTADGIRAVAVVSDVSTVEGAEAPIAAAVETYGRLDVLAHTVGGIKGPVSQRYWEIDDEQWAVTVNISLTAAFRCIRAATPHLKAQPGGRIVTIGSTSWAGTVAHAHYAAAKAGLVALTRSVAESLGPFDATANLVAPGGTRTLVAGHAPTGFPTDEEWKERNPLGRPNEPEDVAAAVAFLASPGARNISGQVITVAGGLNPSL